MIKRIELVGVWDFQSDERKQGLKYPFTDTIRLPGTTSYAKKGKKNENEESGFLTDEYKFEGYAWYEREIVIPEELAGKTCFLYMERTRVTRVWIDGIDAGTRNSLCTPHKYDITDYISCGVHKLTILVDNTNYPTRGGHMTSQDTQTNWNGITGRIELQFFNSSYIEDLQVYPDIVNKEVVIKTKVVGDTDAKAGCAVLVVSAESLSTKDTQLYAESLGSKETQLYAESFSRTGTQHCTGKPGEAGQYCSETNGKAETHSPETLNRIEMQHHTKTGYSGVSKYHIVPGREYAVSPGDISVTYRMGDDVMLWSEYEPNLYRLKCDLKIDDVVVDKAEVLFGMRKFKADGRKFTINGTKTFLRGKHDGLIFPLTGFAPTTVEEWVNVLRISKSYGINHYRFHTCCPPEAAFTAADMLGIYMEPELPFWGTVTDENDENHNAAEQEYLINEGYLILKHFGNHPSFVMMSLGNELWGSQKRLNEILKVYKAADPRHLYTQGSNNFQFVPVILENEDFFCGVRFSKDRLFRGSYATCDAPLGHVQTDKPGTRKDYDLVIRPDCVGTDVNSWLDGTETYTEARLDNTDTGRDIGPDLRDIGPDLSDIKNTCSGGTDTAPENENPAAVADGMIDIQFGTGTKKVSAAAQNGELVPEIPVVSHEIGQYAVFPNFNEIGKYTGPLKAKNFEIFQKHLAQAGLDHLAEKYFRCSGKLSVSCYKEELEAALRSRELAGFQILDLQDFSGQGTALVGMLDAFMDSKGLVTAEEWRTFCSDAVLLARFDKYNYEAGEQFNAHIELCYYRNKPLGDVRLRWELKDAGLSSRMSSDADHRLNVCANGSVSAAADTSANAPVLEAGEIKISCSGKVNYYDLCNISFEMPYAAVMKKLVFILYIDDTDISKSYDLWVYPKSVSFDTEGVCICGSVPDAVQQLQAGARVLLLPDLTKLQNSIEGFYCTDFWCYPMFRSISESVGRNVPVGTMGLLNDSTHPVFSDFPCEEHSTYQWWEIVMNSRPVILDGTPKELQLMVQTIDNFERNHKLGMLFECRVSNGKLLVCACDADKIRNTPEGRQFLYSIMKYVRSNSFEPKCKLSISEIENLLR